MKKREKELIEKFDKEKDNLVNIERGKFDSKIDSIKSQFKAEFERLLKVRSSFWLDF